MDEESEEFCKEYDIDWCLKCCGEDYEKNAESGIYYHTEMIVCDDTQSKAKVSSPKSKKHQPITI